MNNRELSKEEIERLVALCDEDIELVGEFLKQEVNKYVLQTILTSDKVTYPYWKNCPKGERMISESLLCLSLAIFGESRGESKRGQYAVAEVIHNRTKHPDFPDTICGVIKQKSQFSFVRNHRDLKTPPRYELEAWKQAVAVAKDFQRKRTNHVGKAVYFNRVELGVRYKTNVKSVRIGQHVFYWLHSVTI